MMVTDTPIDTDPTDEIGRLIQTFSLPVGVASSSARKQLVDIGDAAVPQLVQALTSESTQVRWEVAKTLAEIRAPESAPALAAALQDEDAGVRWLAADGLGHLGRQGLKETLDVLLAHSKSATVREAIHHVLSTIGKDKQFTALAAPIIEALDGQVAEIACLAPAEAAREAIA